jgi:drug/metabolite transporter (DMT)-like permease
MKRWQAHLAVFIANVIYGANYSIAKIVTPLYIKPFGFILIRVWITTFLFWIAGYFYRREKIKKEDFKRIILCAATGVAANQLMFFKGLSLTSPINAGLVMISNPIFVLLIAFAVYKEKITRLHIIGILLGIAGCSVLILYGGRNISAAASPLGDLFILINAFSYAVYLVLVKPLMKIYHPVTIMKWVFLIGSIMVTPFGYNEFAEVQWSAFTNEIWMATVFVVIGTTFFAYLFNTLGLITLSASVVSVYIYLQPLLAAGFAILLGKDSLHWIHLLSAAFIFTGVYLCINKPQMAKS